MAPRTRLDRRIGLVVAIVALASIATPAATSGAPARRRPTTSLVPQVLVPMTMTDADGVATGADGTAYVTEARRGRVFAVAPDDSWRLVGSGLRSPRAVAVAPDGTVAVATDDGIARLDPGATAFDRADGIGGAGTTGLAYTSDGTLWLTDSDADQLRSVTPDGTTATVPIATAADIVGLAIGADDSLHVIDEDAADVVHRAPDGTETHLGIAGLLSPVALDVEGDRLVVGGPGRVVIREADGSQQTVDLVFATDLDLLADGTVLVAAPQVALRDRHDLGGLLRWPPGGGLHRVPISGDVGSLLGSTIVAEPGGGAIFSSWSGERAYSASNPARSVAPGRPATDRPGTIDEIAPDGTTYAAVEGGLARTRPDGTTTTIPLPPGAGWLDVLAVDEDGVVYGTRNGSSGGWQLLRFDLDGAVTVLVDDKTADRYAAGVAASGDRAVVLTVLASGAGSTVQVLDVAPDGSTTERAVLPATSALGVDLDAAGTAWITGDGIRAVAADGTVEAHPYDGEGLTQDVAVGDDGFLYVLDERLGVLAFDGLVGDAITPPPPGPPAGPPPATPVPGSAAYTG